MCDALAIPTVVCLALFFGLFFGLNYPEIRINNNYLAPYGGCNVTGSYTTKNVCCDTSTGSCGYSSLGGPSCSALRSQYESNAYLAQAEAGQQ